MSKYRVINRFISRASAWLVGRAPLVKYLINESIHLGLWLAWAWWTSSTSLILELSRCSMKIFSNMWHPEVMSKACGTSWSGRNLTQYCTCIDSSKSVYRYVKTLSSIIGVTKYCVYKGKCHFTCKESSIQAIGRNSSFINAQKSRNSPQSVQVVDRWIPFGSIMHYLLVNTT